jgi:hypothetical protein
MGPGAIASHDYTVHISSEVARPAIRIRFEIEPDAPWHAKKRLPPIDVFRRRRSTFFV